MPSLPLQYNPKSKMFYDQWGRFEEIPKLTPTLTSPIQNIKVVLDFTSFGSLGVKVIST